MKRMHNDDMKRIFLYALGVLFVSVVFLGLVLNFDFFWGLFKTFIVAIKPVVYAVLIVFCVNGTVEFYSRIFSKWNNESKFARTVKKAMSVVLGYLTFILILVAILLIVILPLVNESSSIIESIPGYIQSARGWVQSAVESVSFLEGQSGKIMEYVDNSLNLSYDSISKYAPLAIDALSRILSEASSLLIGFIISIYIVVSKDFIVRIRCRLTSAFLSEEKSHKVQEYTMTVYGYFSNYFSERLLYSVIIGIVFHVILWLMNVPLYSFLSLVIGVLTFIPVVGAIFAVGISVFFVFLTAYEMLIPYVIVCLAVMILGYLFLQKRIIRESVRASVTVSLISVVVMFGFMGIIGAIIAVPVYLSVKLAAREILHSYETAKAKKLAAQEENSPDGSEQQ